MKRKNIYEQLCYYDKKLKIQIGDQIIYPNLSNSKYRDGKFFRYIDFYGIGDFIIYLPSEPFGGNNTPIRIEKNLIHIHMYFGGLGGYWEVNRYRLYPGERTPHFHTVSNGIINRKANFSEVRKEVINELTNRMKCENLQLYLNEKEALYQFNKLNSKEE